MPTPESEKKLTFVSFHSVFQGIVCFKYGVEVIIPTVREKPEFRGQM